MAGTFRGLGYYTISAGESYRLDWWSWPGGANQGAQYFSANPLDPDGKLVITEQNKIKGSDGRYYYGFRVTNEGPNRVGFNVEGGGFWGYHALAAYGGRIEPSTARALDGIFLETHDVTYAIYNSDGSVRLLVIGQAHDDQGAIYLAPEASGEDAKLVILRESKTNGGLYGCEIWNEGPIATDFSVQGGGFRPSFSGIGDYTIGGAESFRFDWWSWPDGSDQGAQYFAADPTAPAGKLMISEQNKVLGSDQRYYYGFRVTNPTSLPVRFSVQGGSFY